VLDWRSPAEWKRIFKYYQAGLVNTAFGYGLYALFVWLGLNIYLAQVLSHVLGMTFNYFTYSRYAFAGHEASRVNFIASYGVNYLVNVAVLWAFDRFVDSPYLAGALTVLVASVVNYFVLSKFVFSGHKAG